MGDTPISLKRVRGKPFVKGKPMTGGRKPGVRNLITRDVRKMIIACANELGGLARLIEWCKESEINQRLFWTQIWCRLMPVAIKGSVAHELDVSLKVSGEALRAELEKRNLPQTVFDADEPPLHELKQIEHVPNGNGQDRFSQADKDDTPLNRWSDGDA